MATATHLNVDGSVAADSNVPSCNVPGSGECLYVLGHPVAHSKSPAMFEAVFQTIGVAWSYGLVDAASEACARAFLRGHEWRALNVTTPYKSLALRTADWRSFEAQLAQGANVVVNWAGTTRAYNTDGRGAHAFLRRCGCAVETARVVVCGTGPTALSLMHAFAEEARSVCLCSRSEARALTALAQYRETAAAHGAMSKAQLEALSYETGGLDALASADIVIDATPLGMHAHDPAPFDTAVLSARQTVLDVVYGHGETKLVAAARQRRCLTFDGAGMLVGQAVETLRHLSDITGALALPAYEELFDIMAHAAGFNGL